MFDIIFVLILHVAASYFTKLVSLAYNEIKTAANYFRFTVYPVTHAKGPSTIHYKVTNPNLTQVYGSEQQAHLHVSIPCTLAASFQPVNCIITTNYTFTPLMWLNPNLSGDKQAHLVAGI